MPVTNLVPVPATRHYVLDDARWSGAVDQPFTKGNLAGNLAALR